MINKTLLSGIRSELEVQQKERNQIIGSSRRVLQSAKQAIFALHRGETKQANGNLAEAEKILAQLDKSYNKNNRLRFEGSFKACLEEYVEAKMFSLVLSGKKLTELKVGGIGPEEYIGGLADLTGELVRQAVLQATAGNYSKIKKYCEFSEEIVGFLLKLYLTGYLRQKFDEAKRNLKRLEQIIYEVELRK